jgi:glutaredoxin
MKKISMLLGLALFSNAVVFAAADCDSCKKMKSTIDEKDYKITGASVKHNKKWGQLEFEITVQGQAGRSTSRPAGKMNGAPVDGYVFPTTLKPEDVGFGKTEGIVALALTAHPDFDDTPLWDENADGDYRNDKIVWHPHWVVLVPDKRVPGGLAVKEFDPADTSVVLPKTNPGMPMYMDSPGFQVVTEGNAIRVVVPDYRVRFKTDFKYDAVGAFMQVFTGEGGEHAAGGKMPMLGVYKVYSILSKDLSLPYQVK